MFRLISKKNSISPAIIFRSCSYQYLQQSKVPTMHFQRSLPRLPIPSLDKTCDRFLNSIRPLLSKIELEETEKSARQFLGESGSQLQCILKDYDNANKDSSYISKPWFDKYLCDRSPLPLNCNPLMVMKSDDRTEYQNQIVRATNMVISSLRFWRSFQANILEPEIFRINSKRSNEDNFTKIIRLVPSRFATFAAYAFKAYPLDMSQYHKLFGVTRIPSLGKDKLHQNSDSKHIIVLKRGRMYAVNVLDANGNIESPRIILGRLKKVEHADKQYDSNDYSIGILTTENRDEWALIRSHLECGISRKNKHLLNKVDSALFCLCLDSPQDPMYDDTDPSRLFKHLLGGTATNRWFDKSVSLILSNDGTASVNFEHSWGDGVAVLRYFNEIYNDSINKPSINFDTAPEIESDDKNVSVLNFDMDDKLRQSISKAHKKYIKIANDLEMNVFRRSDLNKVICKDLELSPDFIMQLSFQLAYRIVYGKYVGTYESCSTAAFRHGRTETMRPCTLFTKQMCEELIKSNSKINSSLVSLVKKCSLNHSQLVKEAAMGQGFDRHLFALKNIAENQNFPLPAIFDSKGYRLLNYNIISTSTLSSNSILAGAFGPAVEDGFGIGYSIQNEESGVVVTSYKSKRNGMDFINGLEVAQKYIKNLITHVK